jgi:hypothetical protein
MRFHRKNIANCGDIGSGVASIIGYAHPAWVCGIHLNMLTERRELPADAELSDEEKRYWRHH